MSRHGYCPYDIDLNTSACSVLSFKFLFFLLPLFIGLTCVMMLTGGSRERSDEIAKKIKREKDATYGDEMGRRHMMLSPNSTGTLNTITPCAACKLLRRRCAEECPFSPFFSPHEPQKFAAVHKVFGASNVSKMLMVGLCFLFLY